MLTLFTDFVPQGVDLILASATFGSNLQSLIQSIVGPIFLVVVAIIAFTFLVQRQIMQFVIFLIIAIVIAAILYVPSMIQNLGTGLGSEVTWN
tara:strand:- start:719 stop:997 length:279 start_codon:yes stop_codon:yes gene_type:complete